MYTIENEILKVTVVAKGAELKSVYNKQTGLEYMWDADPAFWAKTSPVLFPIVGTLKNNQFAYNGQSYSLSRHGFARDKEFTVINQSASNITFSIESDADTLKVFPFHFIFSISYSINGNQLSVAYQVQNKGDEPMYFSVGGHPAFKLPLVANTTYEDYHLIFEKEETSGRWPISKDGLIEKQPVSLLKNANVLPLSKELFSKDALVFKHLQSTSVKLVSAKTPHGLDFNFKGFTFLGLWAATGANFVCIEPWCGIADSVDSNGQIKEKEGIIELPAHKNFDVQWQVQFF